jgi:hypothetical protein
MIVLQYEVRPETLLAAIDLAVEYGKPVMFKLAPAHPIDLSFLAKIKFLVVYEGELSSWLVFRLSLKKPPAGQPLHCSNSARQP